MTQRLLRYIGAIAMTVVALVAQVSFPLLFQGVPFFLFFVAVFLSALFFGFEEAVVTTIVATLLSLVLLFPGIHRNLADPVNDAQIVMFAATGLLIAWAVSARRRIESQRHVEETLHLQTVANVAPAIVWITDSASQCIYVNDRWLEYSGRTLAEELGTGWLAEMHPEDISGSLPVFQAAVAGRSPVQLEYRQRRHDGVYRWMLSRAVPRLDTNQEFAGYIGVAVDIDDLRTAQREQQRLTAAVESARERLTAVVSNVPGVVWEAWGVPDERSQRIDFVSDHVTRMLGYTVEEWKAIPNFWLTIVHPDDRDAAASHAREHFLAGGSDINRFRWMTKDGRALWVESNSTVTFDADGKPVGMRGVTVDITARKRAEDSLQFLAAASEVLGSSLDYAATLATTARLAVPALGDWCVVAVAEGAAEPRRVAVAHKDPDKNRRAQRLLNIPRRLEDQPPDVRLKFKKGGPFVLEMDDALIDATTNDPEHAALVRELGAASLLVVPVVARERLLGTLSFVSAMPGRYEEPEIELAEQLARRVAIAIDNSQLYRAAVDASQARDEFLATVSHELRTPMTATLGWVRLMNNPTVDAETMRTGLQAIDHSTRTQARLIDDILDASSIILGKFRMECVPVDLDRLVREPMETLAPALAGKHITFRVDSTRWNGTIQGDPNRLQQVLWNLVTNAVKFGRTGGHIDVVLERVCTTHGNIARITIRDDGIGIEAKFLPFAFERFRQADGGSTRAHGGLGLGLSIVRHITELHGGTVEAKSEGPGKGAEFIIELPAST